MGVNCHSIFLYFETVLKFCMLQVMIFLPSTCHLIIRLGELHYLHNCSVTIDKSINQSKVNCAFSFPLSSKKKKKKRNRFFGARQQSRIPPKCSTSSLRGDILSSLRVSEIQQKVKEICLSQQADESGRMFKISPTL